MPVQYRAGLLDCQDGFVIYFRRAKKVLDNRHDGRYIEVMESTNAIATYALIHSGMGTTLKLYEVRRPTDEQLSQYAEWVRPTMYFGTEIRCVPGTIMSAHVPDRASDVALPGSASGWTLTAEEVAALPEMPVTVEHVTVADEPMPAGYCYSCESYCYGDCQAVRS